MTAIVLITVAALGFWLIGGIALRWGGVVMIALGFLVALGVGIGSGLLLLGAGTLLWLAGHLHYRMRHGNPKSGIARLVLGSNT